MKKMCRLVSFSIVLILEVGKLNHFKRHWPLFILLGEVDMNRASVIRVY